MMPMRFGTEYSSSCKNTLTRPSKYLYNEIFMVVPVVKKVATIASGVVHKVPVDLKEALLAHPDVLSTWNGLTPLARNEWICWTTIVKKPQTRMEHIARLCDDLIKGKRRPCCWPGCPHHRPNAKKWFK
jgi:hypothetical protein